jgi:anthranilate synthase component 2
MKILVLDNYDSFTYNLVHILKELTNDQVDVIRNDEIPVEDVGGYDKILLSPGPGIPEEAGIMKAVIKKYAGEKSILGICLGMQGIAEVFGGRLHNLEKVYHGKESTIRILQTNEPLFRNLPAEIKAGRYHSWVVNSDHLPDNLEITAADTSGIAMGIRHKNYDVKGLQFHPESVMTPYGSEILSNWLSPAHEAPSLPRTDHNSFDIRDTQHGYLFC